MAPPPAAREPSPEPLQALRTATPRHWPAVPFGRSEPVPFGGDISSEFEAVRACHESTRSRPTSKNCEARRSASSPVESRRIRPFGRRCWNGSGFRRAARRRCPRWSRYRDGHRARRRHQIYVTARPEVRAKRRLTEIAARGMKRTTTRCSPTFVLATNATVRATQRRNKG